MTISPGVQIALITAVVLLILVYWFRDRVAEIVFGDAKITLFHPKEIQETIEQAKHSARSEIIEDSPSQEIDWSKVATLFWLGNDLMWTLDMIYRGAAPGRVLQGISHVGQYLNDIGFTNEKFPHKELELAKTILESLDGLDTSSTRNAEILKQHYRTVAKEVESIKWFVSRIAETEEPDFKKLRVK